MASLYFNRAHKRLLYMYCYRAALTRTQWLKLRTYEARMGNKDGLIDGWIRRVDRRMDRLTRGG